MKTAEEILDQVIEFTTKQMQAGVLVKNIKRGLLNEGYSEELADKIIIIAGLKHNEFNHYKPGYTGKTFWNGESHELSKKY